MRRRRRRRRIRVGRRHRAAAADGTTHTHIAIWSYPRLSITRKTCEFRHHPIVGRRRCSQRERLRNEKPSQISYSIPDATRRSDLRADALTLTGVRNDLDSNQTSTVFVPTNEAWYALLFRLGVTKEELFADTIWLADALRYHIVRDIAHTSNMGFGTSLMTDLDDEELHVEKYTDSRRSTAPQFRVNGCFVHPRRRTAATSESATTASSTTSIVSYCRRGTHYPRRARWRNISPPSRACRCSPTRWRARR